MMAEHNHPPMTHAAGLQVGCPRCEQHAAEPTGLDADNLARIWRGEIHTALDMAAFNVLYRAAVTTQRLEEAFMYELVDGRPAKVRERSEVDIWKVGGRA